MAFSQNSGFGSLSSDRTEPVEFSSDRLVFNQEENLAELFDALDQGIEVADQWNKLNTESEEVVLIGGGYVFEESKNIVNKLVLTRVNCEIDGDVYYPKIDLSSWEKISTESFKHDSENEYDFSVETFVKKLGVLSF